MTLTELTSVGGIIAVIGGGTLWLETRYVSQEDINLLTRRIANIEQSISSLREEVERGHEISELRGNIFTIERFVNDLTGRSFMYRAFDQAGIITPEQRTRWVEVRDEIAGHQAEIRSIESTIRSLE